MNKQTKWVETRLRLGWMLLTGGGVFAFLGIIAKRQFPDSPYNFRIITGLGILALAIGFAYLIRYGGALKNRHTAVRLDVEEHDERTLLIRTRAGNRAYWCSAILIYGGLMWESLAKDGGVPKLTSDALWYFLAAAVLIPFGVYIASIMIDQGQL